ncbi:hypothetical protein JX266_003340 [Neoarthrinium moseri]|nr:hypothetical protein JX266_003340 [Neoarthrinium moseri]
MEEAERQQYEIQSQDLRADLKRWEGDWAKKNDGKKPSRTDIKQNPIIAQKYKKYSQVRDILDGKVQPPKKHDKSRKRKSETDAAPVQTPSKRSRPAATPSKAQQHIDIIDSFETPSIRRLFSPVVPTSIGPTPQRDGRVLGLFDLLEENDENTPSRARYGDTTVSDPQVHATPTKRSFAEMDPESAVKLGRTPQSASKRAMLDTFMTPLKKRDPNVQGARTPSTTSKLQFSTPAFLRRAPLPPVDEDGKYVSPRPLRLPRKPLVRGLSSVVASLRKMEEEKLDDDLEALREMENDAEPSEAPKVVQPKAMEDVLIPDNQAPQLLGGFDDEGRFDSDPEEQRGRDGQPLRVFKKKGQKRTTRKVNMRPTRARRPQQSLEDMPSDIEEETSDTVPETQYDSTKIGDSDPVDLGSGSDFSGSDGEGEEEKPKKKTKTAKKTEKAVKVTKDEKENPIKKAAKKVNAMAHANFKRLKLRNNGAKGGPGFGSRFRRRR